MMHVGLRGGHPYMVFLPVLWLCEWARIKEQHTGTKARFG